MGVTYGERRGINAETRQYDYEPGSYSVPFPGRNAHRDKVTMETLDDAGEVIATSCLPVEPKKGGIAWDRDAVRKAAGKVAKPAKGRKPEAVEIAIAPDATEGDILPDLSTESVVMPTGQAETSTAPGLADQVAALAAMVEALQSQVAALAHPPVEGITVVPPIDGKQRTAAHIRAIRSYLRVRRERERLRVQQANARGAATRFMRNADILSDERFTALRKRRHAVLFARDLQKRLNAEHRLVDKQITAKREMLEDMIAMRNQIIALKSKPHHMGQAVNPDDYQRLMRERDEARASLTSDREKLRIMRANMERGTDALNMMTDRALRAENALRAVEQRRARVDAPYRANVRAVTFDIAA